MIDRNLEVIKSKRPELYDKLKEAVDNYDEGNVKGFEVSDARNGSKFMQYKDADKSIRMNSNYNPEREAAEWVKQYDFTAYNSVIVMFGLGSGYYAKAVRESINESSKMIVVEPDINVMIFSMHNFDMTELFEDDRVLYAVGEDFTDDMMKYVSKNVYWMNVWHLQALCHTGYIDIYTDEWVKAKSLLVEYHESMQVEANTEAQFGSDVAYNSAKNMKYMKNAFVLSEFKGRFPEDTTGIVVSAGPSLDKNIHLLHKIKERAVIIATDTSLRSLRKEGIVPDFMVSIDPRKDVDLFENVGYEDVPFICKLESNPEVMDIHKGTKIWMMVPFFLTKLYVKLNKYVEFSSMGGSVATTAFTACRVMGLKRIVLIGQDLAYKGNVSHANGEIRHIHDEESGITYIKGNYEDVVKTRADWVMYLKWFEKQIQKLPELEVINATEGGAYMEGAELMTLQEVYDKYCQKELNITEIIENVINSTDVYYRKEIDEYLDECLNDLKSIEKNMEKGITLCNRFERKYSKARTITGEVSKCYKELTGINNKIGDMPIYDLIDSMVKHEDVKSVKQIFDADEDEYTDIINMINNTKHIYELTRDASKNFRAEFEKNLEIVKEQG